MPKFISSSSGQVYAKDKHKEEEDEILASISTKQEETTSSSKKPAAVNKKGTREKPKSSLELFKEELQRLDEEREEQRNKLKYSLANHPPQQPVPIPLKPDPRCPTALTLQVNLNPKSKDTLSNGSFDTGDPTTTNLYIGNLNPTVTENELCDIFGKFGPLASIKIMWPRTDEERARNRNSGFVAYMSRIDGERALRAVNGMDYKGYDMKLGWGKAVPLPKNPVFIPAELVKLLEPPPRSGLPFNAQLHPDDVERGYKVLWPPPQQVPPEMASQIGVDAGVTSMHQAYQDFVEVFQRSTIHVHVPQDRKLLDRIHKTIEYVIREGPVFESIITARELQNSDYRFLYDYDTSEHVYYRWKLYSLLHGDDPYAWSTKDFRMYADGPLWRPPPINPYGEGMPIELVEKLAGIDREIILGNKPPSHRKFAGAYRGQNGPDPATTANKGKLNPVDREVFEDLLKGIDPTKTKITSAMLFCINHSDAADEVIAMIVQSFDSQETKYKQLIGLIFLISDILHNSSASVPNASFYRQGFKDKLAKIFECLGMYVSSFDDTHQVERFKKKVISVLGSWKYYQLYEADLVMKLSKSLYGDTSDSNQATGSPATSVLAADFPRYLESEPKDSYCDEELDGEPITDSLLTECLEAKGMSLRWYRTLELSDDECDETDDAQSPNAGDTGYTGPSNSDCKKVSPENTPKERFKVSKWELITDEQGPNSPLLGKTTPTTLVSGSSSTQKIDKSGSGTNLQREKQ